MNPGNWIELAVFIAGAFGLFLRDRNQATTNAAALAAHRATMEERVSSLEKNTPQMIRTALLEWQGPFLKELNGTYMRTPLIETHLKGIKDHVDSVQRELTEWKKDIRQSVRHEVRNVMTGMDTRH